VKEAHLLKDGVAWTTGSYTFTVNDKEDKPEQVRGKLACYAWARGHGVEN
jgi:hypothetical protein